MSSLKGGAKVYNMLKFKDEDLADVVSKINNSDLNETKLALINYARGCINNNLLSVEELDKEIEFGKLYIELVTLLRNKRHQESLSDDPNRPISTRKKSLGKRKIALKSNSAGEEER